MAIRFLNSQSIDGELTVTGNVGIGTTSPSYSLDVQSSADSVIRVKTTGTGPSSDSEIWLQVAGTTQSNYIRFGDSGNDYAGGIRYQHVNDSMQFRVNAAEKMRIDSNGNVGIGTTTPSEKLEVAGNIIIDNNTALLSKRVAGNTVNLIGIDNTGQGVIEIGEASTIADGMHIYTPTDTGQGVTFHNGTDPLMFIENDGNVGIGTTAPALSYGGKGLHIQNTDTAGLRLTDTTGADFDISARSGDVLLYEGEGRTIRIGVGGSEKMRIQNDGHVGINNTSPDYELDVVGDIQYSGTLFNGPRQEYSGSNFISANQAYSGNLVGSYFVGGDYQKVVTIIPSGASQNYQIVGKLYAQSGQYVQVIDVDVVLRSNTLPDLGWSIYYKEDNNALRFIKPVLWTKETTTAGFIFAFEVLAGVTIYGSVTADLMINSRSSAHKANVSINTVTASDQTTIDTGYTQQEFTQRSTWDQDRLGIGTTDPSTLLHVSSESSPSIRVTGITSNNSDPAIELLGTANSFSEGGQLWYDNGSGVLHLASLLNNTAADIQFHTAVAADRGTGNVRMTIAGDGNVGIGTTNPIAKLYVDGGALGGTAGNEVALLSLKSTNNNTDTLQFTSERLTTGTDWTSAAQRIQRKIDTTLMGYMQFGSHTDDLITFGEGNTERMRIDGDGDVGIGTTNPIHKLDVAGNARITGAYYDSSNSPGTNGQVLSSTVTGTSWVTGGGGGGATSLNGLSDVLIDGTSSYFVNIPTTLSGNPADNLVIGNGAGNSITTGNKNVILGQGAGNNVSTSVSNVVIGYNAGQGLRTGSIGKNIIIGEGAGSALNQGYGNIMIGYRAGQSATQQNSVYIGYEAAEASSSINGIAIGYRAMYQASGGQRSTVVGYRTCYSTTGSFVEHTAFGYDTLYSQTSGRLNTALGYAALRSGTTFTNNLGVGYKAGYSVTGTGNTLIGANSGFTGTNDLTSGSNNTLIGYSSASSSATVSNEFTLGNSSISTLRCAVTSITSLSDERDKAEIKDLTYGLDFIDSLQPREFIWNNRPEIKLEQVLDENNNEVFDENQEAVYEEVQFYSNNRGKKDFGFVAQEVQDLDDDTLRLVYDSNPDKLEISYGKLVPILVKAIQELKAEIETLKSQ